MQPVMRQYDVHGVGIRVDAEDVRLLESVDIVLFPFVVFSLGDHVDYRVAIRYGTPPGVTEWGQADPLWRSRIFDDAECFSFGDSNQYVIHIPHRLLVRMDLAARRCDVTVRQDSVKYLAFCFVIQMLCEFLGERDHHVLHAACLAVPGPRQQCILLSGVSGAGKSTTSLALARDGLPILADDAVFLVQRHVDGRSVQRLWGLPRPCKVHRNTIEMLDWLKTTERRQIPDSEEFSVAMHQLPAGDSRMEFAPGLVLLMGPRNHYRHQIHELDKLKAITEMTRLNVRTLRGRVMERAGRDFEAVSQLALTSRIFQLSVGPDLKTLKPLLMEKLEA